MEFNTMESLTAKASKSGSGVKALILTDIQIDFVPGGALPVPEGDKIVPAVNGLEQLFELVVATQDWHPPDHLSFAANHPGKRPGDVISLDGIQQTLWPVHCVQDTPGAGFVPGLKLERIDRVFRKATDREIDSYSAFYDNGHRKATGLGEFLRSRNVTSVYLVGLATDYCVKYSALDAVALGFKTYVIQDACRGINLHPGDTERAIAEMKLAGVAILQSH
jgi:nicotinamidase/pyrazinamidase